MGLGIRVGAAEASRLLSAVDQSEDGKIQKPEFFKMLKYLLDS